MRRIFTIVVLAVFALGPLASALPGSAEARLPACCRRAGVHHCAMADADTATGSPQVAAPAQCPAYARSIPGLVTHFLPASSSSPAWFAVFHHAASPRTKQAAQAILAHPGRAPPRFA